jgi:hypothetical protein
LIQSINNVLPEKVPNLLHKPHKRFSKCTYNSNRRAVTGKRLNLMMAVGIWVFERQKATQN